MQVFSSPLMTVCNELSRGNIVKAESGGSGEVSAGSSANDISSGPNHRGEGRPKDMQQTGHTGGCLYSSPPVSFNRSCDFQNNLQMNV